MTNLPELEYISWQEFHQLSFELAQKIQSQQPGLDQIVSIARGGHVLARILSDFLNLPIFSVSIQSYTDIQQQHEIKMTQELAPELIQEHILLVDEVIDSGKTLVRALDYLHDLGAETITSVALHVKPHAIAQPDYFSAETSKWLVYPYEVRETIQSLKPIWHRVGFSTEEMLAELTKLGLPEHFIRQYLAV